ncbi:hypothetical protein ACFL0U_04405, partial [Pseudomonadota bacterium]
IDTSDSSSVAFGSDVDEGKTIEGTCGSGYAGSPQTTCTTAPTWDVLTESCDAASCVSDICTGEASEYCGDNWDCSDDTCCNNNVTSGELDPIVTFVIGDCRRDCTNAIFGNDTITDLGLTKAFGDCAYDCSGIFGDDIMSNTSNDTYGDCYSGCSGTMGNDTISNANGAAFGDCVQLCSGTMGDDTISNTNGATFGDCFLNCSGTMGNDTIIDTQQSVWGDCNTSCTGITQWATDIFRNTGSNSFTIGDFNAGGIDDKIELPSGTTVSISGTGYSRTLTYAGSYSGTLTIQCNSTHHDCDALAGGSWIVKACNVYAGGTSLDSDPTPCGGDCSTAGFDAGTCSFND